MNTSGLSAGFAGRMGVLFSLSIGSAFAAPALVAPANSGPKTHVLFMGADIAVERNKQFYRVEDVTETALVIKADGKTVSIPQSPTVNLGISDALRLAATSVGVEKLNAERVYTPGADPFRRLAQSVALAAGESAVADLANGEVVRANAAVLGANNRMAQAGNPQDRGEAAAAIASNGVHETRLNWGFFIRRLSRTVSLRMTAVRATLAGFPFSRSRR